MLKLSTKELKSLTKLWLIALRDFLCISPTHSTVIRSTLAQNHVGCDGRRQVMGGLYTSEKHSRQHRVSTEGARTVWYTRRLFIDRTNCQHQKLSSENRSTIYDDTSAEQMINFSPFHLFLTFPLQSAPPVSLHYSDNRWKPSFCYFGEGRIDPKISPPPPIDRTQHDVIFFLLGVFIRLTFNGWLWLVIRTDLCVRIVMRFP